LGVICEHCKKDVSALISVMCCHACSVVVSDEMADLAQMRAGNAELVEELEAVKLKLATAQEYLDDARAEVARLKNQLAKSETQKVMP
jgi:septal ring factor EnvC (AmiA/AmiB activator)